MIHHQLDYILTLIDPVTEGPVLGPNRFYVGDIAIKPSKQLDNQFIFVNLLSSPKYFHVSGKEALPLLTWSNPYYKPLSVDVGAGGSLHRVAVSENYPFRQGQTLIKVSSEMDTDLRVKVPTACGRYHTSGAEKGNGALHLSASKTKGLVGRQFLISEGDYSEAFMVLEDSGLCRLAEPLKNSYSDEALVEEVISLKVCPEAAAFVPLRAFDRDVQTVTVELVYNINDLEKPLKTEVSSGKLNEVTLSK